MNARPLPIATALVIALVTIVTLVLGAFGGFIYWAESERRWDQLRQSLATNADRIAANLAVPIRALDDSQTTAIVRSATSDREIVAIEASTPRKRFAVGRDAQWLPVSVDALPTDADLLVAERNIDLDGTSIGRLKLLATSRFMEEELGAWRAAALGVGLLLDLALVLSLYGLLWTLVLRPVTAIERIAASVKHGGAETASHPNVWLVAELKDLRDSIKEMIGMLDSRYQALQASENRLRLATRAANIGVWDWDVTTNALVWDEEMCRQYGIRSEEFSGTYAAWANAVVPQDLEPAVDNIQAALRGEREFDSEFTIRRPDGSSRVIKGESMTIRDDAGQPLRMVGVNFDITEQRRAEQEIKTLNAELERRVRERTAQLEAAIDELARARDAAESATRAKSEFLANMSHEIRTPMNAMIGMTRLALRTRLSAKQQGYLTNAMAAAESLLGIINDILDFSKIEAGKLELESREFFLQDVLDKVTAVVGPKAREKGLEYLIDTAQGIPPSLVGDSLRLEQVLINLCTNAIKFTSAGEILVTLSAVEEAVADRAKIRFSVRDTGIGVSKDQMEGLFQPFNQLDTSTTRKYGGTGLGLAICKKLVTLMRGDIGVKSVPGEGSDFFFSAAFGIGTAVPKWASEAPFPVADRRVLVVDDSQSSRKILFDLLQSVGCRPVLVGSATDALAEIDRASAERPYDLVLVDWKMPDAQGLDLAFRIRDRKSAASPTKIVLLTPFGDEALNRGAVTERLDGCLSKPVSESSLMDTLKMAFGDRPEAGVISDAQGRSDSEAPPGLSGRRVLLVEDNEYNQIVAAELLTDVAGAVVTVARNGQEAVERARAERFDVALMDIQMPIMDGYQAAALIRADAQTANMPIIAMTAHAMARDRERCLAAGMNDYITKPLHPREFFGVLAKWIGGAEPVAGPRRATVVEAIEPAVARATPSVSFALGLHRCVGRVDLYERILDRFLNSRLSEPADIRHALDRADLKQAARIAHSSISTAGTIGANGLSDCARELQLAIDAGDADRWPELVDTFARQHAVVASDIRRYFAEKPSV